MISIGAVYQGPELQGSQINQAIMVVSKTLKSFRGAMQAIRRPWVNAVFVVPGSLGDIGFQGLKYGDYSKKDSGIVVQIAVPAEVVGRANSMDFIVDSLRGANAMAFEFFRQKGEEFPLAEAENLVGLVAKKLEVIQDKRT